MSPGDAAIIYPNVAIPTTANVRVVFGGSNLRVDWETSIGTSGSGNLSLSDGAQPSRLATTLMTWNEFKQMVLALEPRSRVFRGQSSPARLRTSFHRTHRKNLVKYINVDIPALRRELSAQTKHFFRIDDSLENGAFWNLLQHHGYPTPLLDWTYSPFVAAYFAFRHFRRSSDVGEFVRIYLFDSESWKRDFTQFEQVTFSRPHLSVIETIALENPRALPQQSLSTVTNCDDIESYIRLCEAEVQKQYLWAIDLDYGERHAVLRELSLMGITSASLFPGIDGACEEVKARYFGYNV